MGKLSKAGFSGQFCSGWFVLLILLLGFAGPSPAYCLAGETVSLKTELEKVTAPLFFSEVINGELPAALVDFPLGDLPEPGRSRFINRSDIITKARHYNKPVPKFKGRTLRTHVHRTSRQIDGDQLERRVFDLLHEKFSKNGQLKLEIKQLPDDIEIPDGSYSVELASRNPYHRLRGSDWYPFKIIQEDETVVRFRVRASLRQFSRVPVALNNIPRGKEISADDIIWEEREISKNYFQFPADTASITGLETNRSFRAGEILDMRGLKRPLKVQRRGQVTIVYNIGNIRVSAPGIAEDDGALGDEIVVKNNSSGDKVYVEVIGERKVKAKNE